MKIIIKIVLSAILFGCVFKMPYGYYQLVRWIVCAGFVYFAYKEYELKNTIVLIICGVVAVLFNPLKPIYFKKESWLPIDLAIAIALILWIMIDLLSFLYGKEKNEKKDAIIK